jgi:hypothetical protein
MNHRVTELRGETGERGLPGTIGATGPAGKDAKFKIGVVVQGDKAEARIREGGDNTFILDLCLPRGEQGPRGFIGLPGPAGVDGKNGVDGVDGKNGERGFSGANGQDSKAAGPRGERGADGESIVGPRGEKGDTGMTREEIIQILIETLQNVGVMTEQAQKLLAIRAKLKAAINEADARHSYQISEIIRDVDKLF